VNGKLVTLDDHDLQLLTPFGLYKGHLGLSRALGDFRFKAKGAAPKDHMVTAFPEVQVRRLEEDDEFVIMACDGEYCLHSPRMSVFFNMISLCSFRDMGLSE
jgi:hypothetical protein